MVELCNLWLYEVAYTQEGGMQIAASTINTLASAASPEDAARIFIGTVSQALAQVMADSLSNALNAAVPATAGNPAIQGWQSMVGGLAVAMDWSSATIIKPQPIVRVANFCAYTGAAAGYNPLGVNISAGVNITASF